MKLIISLLEYFAGATTLRKFPHNNIQSWPCKETIKLRKTCKKVYSTKIFFIKVVVEQDAPSLEKNVSATSFYETVKATISKSSLGACFSVAIFLWNVEISHFLLKTFAEIKLNM